jgi:hypothetical protein
LLGLGARGKTLATIPAAYGRATRLMTNIAD